VFSPDRIDEGADVAAVFISHRKVDADRARAERLASDLKGAGHHVWFDEWEIDPGDSIVERMNEGLEGAAYLVLCYSDTGVSAPWIGREWMSALARQLGGAKMRILPVRLTGDKAPAILADIKTADLMRDWDTGLVALLRAIK
jgi:hypothetical protein